jgi:hypothetical protein
MLANPLMPAQDHGTRDRDRGITIREARAPWQLLGEWLARLRRG